jgi:crotonobetainyl-CoA:carnitine CoA-transferase CaiB-like acyl-CoA transferase
MSAYFYGLNRGKRSLAADLRTAAGAEVARRLIAGADVVIENWRPGVAARLGLDGDTLRAAHPRLVTVAVRGYGETGPYAGDRVYDPVVQGVSGMAASQGGSGPPQLVHTVLPDKLAAMAAVQGVLAALLARGRTGRGRHVPVRMVDVAVSFLWPDILRGHTFADAGGPGHGDDATARTSALSVAGDGAWLAYTAVSAEDWRGLCTVARRPDLFEPYRRLGRRASSIDELAGLLSAGFADRDRATVLAELRSEGVPAGPVHAPADVLTDPQIVANATVSVVDRPGLGRVREPVPLVPGGDAPADLGPAPAHGEHTDEILGALGYDAVAVRRLRADGAVT